MSNLESKPVDILIVGAGLFGLSTALAILNRPQYSNAKVTILDTASKLPNLQGASIDSSRILRADYALQPYTKLVSEAKLHWKDTSDSGWGGQGRYHDARLLLTAQPGTEGHVDGYLEESYENLRKLAQSGEFDFDVNALKILRNKAEIKAEVPLLDVSGQNGYINGDCGWVNAEACMCYAIDRLSSFGTNRLEFRYESKVSGLLWKEDDSGGRHHRRCLGVELVDGSRIDADLVILSAGAWTPSLIDLKGRAMAAGQVLAYMALSEEEQEEFKSIPIVFNVSRGMFMVPPHHRELKVGRHGFGYQNPTKVFQTRFESGGTQRSTGRPPTTATIVSTPWTDTAIPPEAEATLKEFLFDMFPQWRGREFYKTRVCWYCDTPTGDFLIDYHPEVKGLFVATGDSGHGFKVFPVIGEKIVDAVQRRLDPELWELWRWKLEVPAIFDGTDDGTRGGRRGMILQDELLGKAQPKL